MSVVRCLDAHAMIASDETFMLAILERMRRERVNPEWALAAVAGEFEQRLAASDSATMRAPAGACSPSHSAMLVWGTDW